MAYNVGPLMASNNLSDVNNVPEARFNISLGSSLPYPAVTGMTSVFVPTGCTSLALDGYYKAGDGGESIWNKSASEPSHPIKFQSADGAWWEISFSPIINPLALGLKTDGTDTSSEWSNLVDYVNYVLTNRIYSTGTYGTQLIVNGGGLVYASANPLTMPPNCVIENCAFHALAGTNWSGNSGATLFGKGNNGLVVIGPAATAYNITFRNNIVDCNYVDEVQAIYCNTANKIVIQDNDVRHWGATGNGLIMDEGGTALVKDNTIFRVLGTGDPDWGVQSKAYGMAIGNFSWDSTFSGNSFGQCLVPLYCGPRSSMNRYIDNHPWQSYPGVGTVWTNPYGIYYEGFRSIFDTTYMDSCPFFHNVTVLQNSDGYPVPQVTIVNTISIYAATASTFSEWYQMSTSVANTPLDRVTLDGNYWDTGAIPWSFETTGSGSYAMGSLFLSRLNAARYDSQFLASRSASWVFQGDTDFLGSEVRGNRISVNVNHSTAYTLSDYDAGELLALDAGSAVTITAPSAVSTGFQCEIYLSGAGGTLTPAASCAINGSGSAITLTQNKLYKLTCFYSSGGSALYGLLGV